MSITTIVALSSGALPSGVAVVRLSGPSAFSAVRALCPDLPPPRRLVLRKLFDPSTGALLDSGLVVLFPGPCSFTGEDCAELQVHGSPAGIKAILAALTALPGVSLAGAGDFTRRAFENGKLDLVEIEGLGDLLAAETETQRRQALSRLGGRLSERIAAWRGVLLEARAEIEARLDFADEDDVPEALPPSFIVNLGDLCADLSAALDGFERGRLQREGFTIILAGPPNVGKSSLLNALSGSELAIVTAEPGTTRDVREVAVDLGGHLVLLTDTAGLRETQSVAEAEGIRRAVAAMETADLVLWLSAPDVPEANMPPLEGVEIWPVAAKGDLAGVPNSDVPSVSTRTKDGLSSLISALAAHIEARAGASETVLISHLRDKQAIKAALRHGEAALATLPQPELCAEELRGAADSLARMIGLMDAEHVLDRLFAGFCIGK